MNQIQDVFTREQLEELQSLQEVIEAQKKLATQSSVSFFVPLTQTIRKAIESSFGLDLSSKTEIPCRWIKGDTAPHIDRGASSFEKTYLVYLTDGEGEFVLGDDSYSIVAGTGYSFSEGLSHEVMGAGDSTRLLLGPMSEQGFAVGGQGLNLDPGETGYIREDSSGNLQYKTNQVDWTLISSSQIFILQNNDPDTGRVFVEFLTDITINNADLYFEIKTKNIQIGSTSLKSDGTRPKITMSGISDYPGLFQNGSSGGIGYEDIYIYNLEIVNSSSTLATGGGWIGQEYFGKSAINNYIINCISDGDIPLNGGGIVGQYAAYKTTDNSSLTILGCSSTGSIGTSAGGIAGKYAGNNGTSATVNVTIEQCFSEGAIGQSAGGIVGESAGNVSCIKCYSTGAMGNAAGGIFGRFGGEKSDNSALANKCYSTGTIGVGAGGIFGRESGTTSGSATASNCYSTGSIDSTTTTGRAGGIFGREYANQTTVNCYASGTTTEPRGYILADSTDQPSTTYSEAKNGGSGWDSTNANSVLDGYPINGVGNTWASTGTNTPYELVDFGPTPYQRQSVSGTNLVQSSSQSVSVGSSTNEALNADAPGNAFSILKKTGGDTASHTTITISSQTGAISTTSATVPGTYTLKIRSVGSYFITTFVLTVSPDAVPEETAAAGCCVSVINERGLDYAQINNYRIGNRLLLEVSQNPKTNFDGYSQYVKYKMAQGSRKI